MDVEYYISQYHSNDPGEDRYSVQHVPSLGSFFCVVDGHGGCFSCELANSLLIDYLVQELSPLSLPYNSKQIIQIISDSFQRCDRVILQRALSCADTHTHSNSESKCPGKTGCCVAIAAFIGDRLYVAHVGDCRVVVCRSLSYPYQIPAGIRYPETVSLVTSSNLVTSSSPQKRGTRNRNFNDLSSHFSPQKRTSSQHQQLESIEVSNPPIPEKRSRGDDGRTHNNEKESQATSNSHPQSLISAPTELAISPPLKRGLIVRDFHLEAVVNNQPETSRRRQQPETPSMVTVASQDSQLLTVEIEPTSTPTNTPHTSTKPKDKKKKKKQSIFTESDFDYSEFTGSFSELGLSLHCLTKDHCCDDNDERIALKMLCPSDPKPMRPSVNDKKLFGKDAIKRVGGTLAVTRALGDGYLKLPLLSEEPFKSHVPYITGLPFVSCRRVLFGIDLFLILASDGLWNYISIEEVAFTIHEYLLTNKDLHSEVMSRTPISESFNPGNPSHHWSHSHSSHPRSRPESITEILLRKCLTNAAHLSGISYESLLALPNGSYKRGIVDDVTILVAIIPVKSPFR